MLQTIDQRYNVSVATIQDAEQILTLLKEVATWLNENNINQWASIAEGKHDEEIIQSIQHEETFCVKQDDHLVATFVLYQKQAAWDINLWGHLKEDSLYIHKLALARAAIGDGLGKKVLQWIENYTTDKGLSLLRLDCIETNRKLNRFYLSNGFKKCGSHNGFSLYEKVLHKQPL